MKFQPRGKTSHDIRSEITELADAAQTILDAAHSESRDLTPDEEVAADATIAQIKMLQGDLSRVEADEARKRALAESIVALNHHPAATVRPGILGHPVMSNIRHVVPKLSAFKNTAEGQRDAYLAGNWWKAVVMRSRGSIDEHAETICANAGFDIRASMTEGTATAGGYLVPTPMSNAIIETRAAAGVARRAFAVTPMTSETLTVPKLLAGPAVGYPGEAGAFTDSDEGWGQVQLTAKKRGILTKISRELRDDALISVVDQLASRMGHEFALKEDAEVVNGDGTSTYGGEVGLLASLGAGGIYAPSNGTGKSVWSGLTMTEFTDTMAKLPSKYHGYPTSWLCSSQFYWGVMAKLLASAGGNTMMVLEGGTAAVPTFLGSPVYITDQMPTATAVSTVSALFGAFAEAAILGDRQGVEIVVSDQRYFEYDLIGVRGVTRYDVNVHDSGDASNAGAYVGLQTAAS